MLGQQEFSFPMRCLNNLEICHNTKWHQIVMNQSSPEDPICLHQFKYSDNVYENKKAHQLVGQRET